MTRTDQIVLPPLDPDGLKGRFKKICTDTNNVYQNWQIRVHRSLSWSKKALTFPDDQPEARLLYLWIALNSLYARWSNRENRPDHDGGARQAFVRKLGQMDAGLVLQLLRAQRALLKKLLSDPCLSNTFWANPSAPDADKHATADVYHLDGNLKRGLVGKLLGQALDRISVLRGQIVHGASTSGSRLNRSAVRNCLEMLQALVPLIQHVVIERGCGDDWPEMCYPPLA